MPDETEPTPAAPAPDATEPAASPDGDAAERRRVQVPKWLAVGAAAVALVGGGFAVGHVTASEHHGDHHGDSAQISDNRPGGPGGQEGRGGPDRARGGDENGPSAPGGSGGANAPTTPSTTDATPGA